MSSSIVGEEQKLPEGPMCPYTVPLTVRCLGFKVYCEGLRASGLRLRVAIFGSIMIRVPLKGSIRVPLKGSRRV